MRSDEGLLSQLPSLERLREAYKRAGEGRGTAATNELYYMETLEALVGRGRFGYLNVNLCRV